MGHILSKLRQQVVNWSTHSHHKNKRQVQEELDWFHEQLELKVSNAIRRIVHFPLSAPYNAALRTT